MLELTIGCLILVCTSQNHSKWKCPKSWWSPRKRPKRGESCTEMMKRWTVFEGDFPPLFLKTLHGTFSPANCHAEVKADGNWSIFPHLTRWMGIREFPRLLMEDWEEIRLETKELSRPSRPNGARGACLTEHLLMEQSEMVQSFFA